MKPVKAAVENGMRVGAFGEVYSQTTPRVRGCMWGRLTKPVRYRIWVWVGHLVLRQITRPR